MVSEMLAQDSKQMDVVEDTVERNLENVKTEMRRLDLAIEKSSIGFRTYCSMVSFVLMMWGKQDFLSVCLFLD